MRFDIPVGKQIYVQRNSCKHVSKNLNSYFVFSGPTSTIEADVKVSIDKYRCVILQSKLDDTRNNCTTNI